MNVECCMKVESFERCACPTLLMSLSSSDRLHDLCKKIHMDHNIQKWPSIQPENDVS